MYSSRQSAPFNPVTYSTAGTFRAMLQGLEETLRRWDEIDPVTALRLPAYFLEALEAQGRHGVLLLAAARVADFELELAATAEAAEEILERVAADGYDAEGILLELRLAMRPEIEKGIARMKPSWAQRALARLVG